MAEERDDLVLVTKAHIQCDVSMIQYQGDIIFSL